MGALAGGGSRIPNSRFWGPWRFRKLTDSRRNTIRARKIEKPPESVSRWAAPWHDVGLRHGEEPALVSSVRAGRIKTYRRPDKRMAEIALPWCWRRDPRFHMLVMTAPLVVVLYSPRLW